MISRNYPTSIGEAQQTLLQSAIGGYRIETIGEWLQNRPKPLPESVSVQLAASIAENPVTFGRLFLHAIQAAREANHG